MKKAVWFETSRKHLLTWSVREDWPTSGLQTTLLIWLVGREDRPTVLILFFRTTNLHTIQFAVFFLHLGDRIGLDWKVCRGLYGYRTDRLVWIPLSTQDRQARPQERSPKTETTKQDGPLLYTHMRTPRFDPSSSTYNHIQDLYT
jgi:hypothetical protein